MPPHHASAPAVLRQCRTYAYPRPSFLKSWYCFSAPPIVGAGRRYYASAPSPLAFFAGLSVAASPAAAAASPPALAAAGVAPSPAASANKQSDRKASTSEQVDRSTQRAQGHHAVHAAAPPRHAPSRVCAAAAGAPASCFLASAPSATSLCPHSRYPPVALICIFGCVRDGSTW